MNINSFVSNIGKRGVQDTSRYSLAFYPRPNPNRSLSEDVDDITFADLFLEAGGFSDRITLNRTMSERCMSLSLPSIKIDQNTNTSRGIDYEVPKAYSYSQDLSMTFLADKKNNLYRFFNRWTRLIYNDNLGRFRYPNQYAFRLDVDLLGRNQDSDPRLTVDNQRQLSSFVEGTGELSDEERQAVLDELKTATRVNERYSFTGVYPTAVSTYKLDTAKSDLATFDVSFSYYQFAPIRVAEDEPVSPLDAQDTFSRTLGLRDV
tara:strand:+ start:384 stop:1169 length:786 start_codon:yes stop_codon:yes gene_type:complete